MIELSKLVNPTYSVYRESAEVEVYVCFFKFVSFSHVTFETILSSVFIVCCSVEKGLLLSE